MSWRHRQLFLGTHFGPNRHGVGREGLSVAMLCSPCQPCKHQLMSEVHAREWSLRHPSTGPPHAHIGTTPLRAGEKGVWFLVCDTAAKIHHILHKKGPLAICVAAQSMHSFYAARPGFRPVDCKSSPQIELEKSLIFYMLFQELSTSTSSWQQHALWYSSPQKHLMHAYAEATDCTTCCWINQRAKDSPGSAWFGNITSSWSQGHSFSPAVPQFALKKYTN